MKYFVLLLFSVPFLIFAQIDTNWFNEVEKSKLIKTEQLDWAKIEWYEKGTVIYTYEGIRHPAQRKIIEIFIDSIVYTRDTSGLGVFHYKNDLKSKVLENKLDSLVYTLDTFRLSLFHYKNDIKSKVALNSFQEKFISQHLFDFRFSMKHGRWMSNHRNGSNLVEVSCNYVNDTLDGEFVIYENNHSGYFIELRVNYKMGIPDGVYEEYDRNGNIEVKGQFLNGEKVGVWIINENTYHNPKENEDWYKSCDYCYYMTKSIYREFYPDGIRDTEITFNYERFRPSLNEISSKIIKTEYYKNNEYISCEGDCE